MLHLCDGYARRAIRNTTRRAKHVEVRKTTLGCLHGLDERALGAHGLVTKGQMLGDQVKDQSLILGNEDETNPLILGMRQVENS